MLIDISTSSPPYKVDQVKAAEELKLRMSGKAAIARLIDMAARNSGINNRYIVIPDAENNLHNKFYTYEDGSYLKPDTMQRMKQYKDWSIKLTCEAVEKLMQINRVNPNDIKRLITISCTGFFAPGIDYHLINKFKLPASVKRTHIGFMGCAAALAGINTVWEALSIQEENLSKILLVAVEICSIHLQTDATRDNILANMIFADGAAAAIFSNYNNYPDKYGFKIISANSVLFKDSAEYMGWKIGNYGFEMMLSSELPKIILKTGIPNVLSILEKTGINKNEIKFWALHPGGRSILDSLQQGLELSEEQMQPSRIILRDYGNMSSVSILFVLREILHKPQLTNGDYCCAIAFGPGLTMEVVLFQVV